MSFIEKTNYANRKNYGSRRSLNEIKYIPIHFTGNDGDTDENNGKYFHNNVTYTSAHDFIDSDSVTHSVPYDFVAYSVGGNLLLKKGSAGKYYGKCTNNNSVSVEICDDKENGTIYPSPETLSNAINHATNLCKKFGLNPKTSVIRHYEVNGKLCPAYWVDDNKWKKEFLNLVIEKYNGKKTVTQKIVQTIKNIISVKPPFKVNVTISSLNVRENPNMSGKILSTVGNKEVIIEKVSNGWGKIYNSGWIYLENPNYCKIGAKTTLPKKSITQIAKEVINGKWGNGETRKKKLKSAGYDYSAVQKEVNRLLK